MQIRAAIPSKHRRHLAKAAATQDIPSFSLNYANPPPLPALQQEFSRLKTWGPILLSATPNCILVRLRESSTDCNFSSNYKADAEDLALLCIRLHEAVFQRRLRTLHSCGWSNSRGRKRYSSHENTEVQKYRVKAQTLSTSTPQQAQHHKGAAVCPKSYHML